MFIRCGSANSIHASFQVYIGNDFSGFGFVAQVKARPVLFYNLNDDLRLLLGKKFISFKEATISSYYLNKKQAVFVTFAKQRRIYNPVENLGSNYFLLKQLTAFSCSYFRIKASWQIFYWVLNLPLFLCSIKNTVFIEDLVFSVMWLKHPPFVTSIQARSQLGGWGEYSSLPDPNKLMLILLTIENMSFLMLCFKLPA